MMDIRRLALAAALAASSLAEGQTMRGVNLSGAEWGENTIPGKLGTQYTFHSERSYQYWTAKGMGLIRLPFRWERLQPVPGGPLDPDYLELLKKSARWAESAGAKLIIEPHNFGRFKINEPDGLKEYILDNQYGGVVKVSKEQFADFWARVSQEFKDDPGVWAYDLMNEPHDMGQGDWKTISQAAVDAIRGLGDNKPIYVPGTSWSSADAWPRANGGPWIQDPADNFIYEAHLYFDRDNSGTYTRTYDQEAAYISDLPNWGRRRVMNFIDWCKTNNVRGFLGEFGAPWDDPRWLEVIENFMQPLDEAGMDAAYWAAGEWWESYKIGIQPLKNFTVDRPQVALMQKHLPSGWLAIESLASGSGYQFAPASLVAVRGVGLMAEKPEDTVVELEDSQGQVLRPELRSAGPERIEYQLPTELAAGLVKVRVLVAGETAAAGQFTAARVAPSLFRADGDAARGWLVRADASGEERWEHLGAVEFGAEGERLYLVLEGTGIRNRTGPDQVILKLGQAALPVISADADAAQPGVDQVRVELPRDLAGAGELVVQLRVEGRPANEVKVFLR